MVCVQVIGLDTAVSVAGSQGNFELNVFKPVMIFDLLTEIRLLSDSCRNFREYAVKGIQANRERISALVNQSLMLVTALSPKIGYDNAAAIAKQAYHENRTLKEVCVRAGYLTAEEYDQTVRPEKMTNAR